MRATSGWVRGGGGGAGTMPVWRNRDPLKNEDTNRLARPHDRTAPIRGYFSRDLKEPHPIEPLTTLIGDADPAKSQSEGRILGRFASPWSAARCAARSETDTVLDQNDDYKVWKGLYYSIACTVV